STPRPWTSERASRVLLDAPGCQDSQNQSVQIITVVDPFHPLFGRTFPIAVQHRSPREPLSFEVEHGDGIILRIAATSTDRAYCPPNRRGQEPPPLPSGNCSVPWPIRGSHAYRVAFRLGTAPGRGPPG